MRVRIHNPGTRVWTQEFVWLIALSLSYFYCLPLLRTGMVLDSTASEVRIYDLVFLLFLIIVLIPRMNHFMHAWRSLSEAHRLLLWWVIVSFFALALTYVFNERKLIVAMVRYFRFVSFSVVFVYGFLAIRNRSQLQVAFHLVVFSIGLISIVGSLQSFGYLPNLWPDYYNIYVEFDGGYLSTATLAPNHTHYSLVMAIGIVMIITSYSLSPRLSQRNIVYFVFLMAMLYSMIASRGRSGWLVLGVYILFQIVLSRDVKIFVLVLLAGLGFYLLIQSNVRTGEENIQDILLYRSINAHKQLGRTALDIIEETDKNWIERVDDNRWYIYKNAVAFLLDNPQFILHGAGFQNAVRGIGGVALAAHNAYLNALAELGIVGFSVYVLFLFQLGWLAWQIHKMSRHAVQRTLALSWFSMFIGLCAANFFGEIIYPGRALFTFLGTFFAVAVVFLHPAWKPTWKPRW